MKGCSTQWVAQFKGVICLSIKPIDFQIMVPRTLDAAKAASDSMQRNQGLQQQQASATQRKAAESLKQVYSQSQAEHARITEKQKEGQQGERKQERDGHVNEDKEEKEKNRLNNEISTSTIDIKI